MHIREVRGCGMTQTPQTSDSSPRRSYRRRPLVVHEAIVVVDWKLDGRAFLERLATHDDRITGARTRSAEPLWLRREFPIQLIRHAQRFAMSGSVPCRAPSPTQCEPFGPDHRRERLADGRSRESET